MTNTNKRTEQIQTSAQDIVSGAGGPCAIDELEEKPRTNLLRDMAKALVVKENCNPMTARSHIAKALRRMRDPNWQPPQRGGKRPGAGRPPETKTEDVMGVNGAWYTDELPNHIVVELEDGSLAKFYMTPFRKVKAGDLSVYKGYHPSKRSGNPLPAYLYSSYGLKKA